MRPEAEVPKAQSEGENYENLRNLLFCNYTVRNILVIFQVDYL